MQNTKMSMMLAVGDYYKNNKIVNVLFCFIQDNKTLITDLFK